MSSAEQRRAAAAAKAEAKVRIDELEPHEHLAADELDELERLSALAYGEYNDGGLAVAPAARPAQRSPLRFAPRR